MVVPLTYLAVIAAQIRVCVSQAQLSQLQ